MHVHAWPLTVLILTRSYRCELLSLGPALPSDRWLWLTLATIAVPVRVCGPVPLLVVALSWLALQSCHLCSRVLSSSTCLDNRVCLGNLVGLLWMELWVDGCIPGGCHKAMDNQTLFFTHREHFLFTRQVNYCLAFMTGLGRGFPGHKLVLFRQFYTPQSEI